MYKNVYLAESENAKMDVIVLEFYKNSKKNAKIKSDVSGLLNKLISRNEKPHIYSECFQIIEKFESLIKAMKNVTNPLYEEYLNHTAVLFVIDIICFMDGIKSLNSKNGRKPFLVSVGNPGKFYNNTVVEVKRAYTDIIDNYLSDLSNKKVSLSELTVRLNLSRRQTIRLIKQIYNANFSDVILITRMTIAKSMIQNTDLTFERISEYVGYSYNGFLRAFKKLTGKTPSEFRKATPR